MVWEKVTTLLLGIETPKQTGAEMNWFQNYAMLMSKKLLG